MSKMANNNKGPKETQLPSSMTLVVFLISIDLLFAMPLIILIVKTICCSVPCLLVWMWLNWNSVEKFLKWRAEAELTHEFGTTDVCVEHVHLKFGENGCVITEFKNTRVGEDFLRIDLLRITCGGIYKFLTSFGLQILPFGFIMGFYLREFDSIEVHGCYMHIEPDMNNSLFYKDHITKERNKSKIKLKKGKNDLHQWRSEWKRKNVQLYHNTESDPHIESKVSHQGTSSENEKTSNKTEKEIEMSNESSSFDTPRKNSLSNDRSPIINNKNNASNTTTSNGSVSSSEFELNNLNDLNEEEIDEYGIEEIIKLGSLSEMFNMLRSQRQSHNHSKTIQEISDWKNIEKRLLDASTIKCGLIRCTSFEFVIKERHMFLHEPWELIGFVGTFEKFRYKVCFEIRGERYGVLPTIIKDSGKEAVKETVAHFRSKVEESRFGKLIGNIRSRNATSPAPSPEK